MKKKRKCNSENDNRPFLPALVYERDGDLNLTWLLVLLMGIAGIIGFLWAVFTGASVPVLLAAWSFMGASFVSVLIAAIPIAKAKILAKSDVPGQVAKAIASVSDVFVEASTDVQEGHNKNNSIQSEIG